MTGAKDLPSETEVVVVGAGPAGLAVAACLQQRGISHALLEKADAVGAAWRNHYDRLHLHTSKSFSGLPYFPMPKHLPKYPSRQQVVDYLTEYVSAAKLNPQFGIVAEGLSRVNGTWTTATNAGKIKSRAVVVATGFNGEPVIPKWPGLAGFTGQVIHSSKYRNGAPFANQNVLIVGFGNSGGEIALDLVERGARPTISVRGPVNIIPRDVLGIPILAIAVLLAKCPPTLGDLLSWPLLKAYYPNYKKLGLQKAKEGPFAQIATTSRIPLLDIGTVKEIRGGRIQVAPDISKFTGNTVTFSDGQEKKFQAVILATGFKPGSTSILPPKFASVDGTRTMEQNVELARHNGLFLCGFYVASTGMLREISMEAKQIATDISAVQA